MPNNIDNLYKDIKKNLTELRLKNISIDIIDIYKNRDFESLVRIASAAGIESTDANFSRVFAKVIQIYHPDRLNKLLKETDSLYQQGRFEELHRLNEIYSIDFKSIQRLQEYVPLEPDEYSYSSDDFGYGEYDLKTDFDLNEDESDTEETIHDEPRVGHSFIEAINNLYFGGLELAVSISDLNNLDEDLDLSDYDIDDLSGIENCENISTINLSGNMIIRVHKLAHLIKLESLFLSENEIEDIRPLANLVRLKELDISFNRIMDFSPLLEMGSLEYVNIMQNPGTADAVIAELKKRGVMVIY